MLLYPPSRQMDPSIAGPALAGPSNRSVMISLSPKDTQHPAERKKGLPTLLSGVVCRNKVVGFIEQAVEIEGPA